MARRPRAGRDGRMALQPHRHTDSVDAGTALCTGGAAGGRRADRRAAGRSPSRPMDHRDVARTLFHAACDPRSRRLVAAAGDRRRVCDRRRVRHGPSARPSREHRPHDGDLRQRAGRGGGDGRARRSLRRARRSRGGGAEPAHPDRGGARSGGVRAPRPARQRSLRARDERIRCPGLRAVDGGDRGGRRRGPVAAPAQRVRAGVARGRHSPYRRRNQSVGDAHARVQCGAMPDRLRARRAIRARFPARRAALCRRCRAVGSWARSASRPRSVGRSHGSPASTRRRWCWAPPRRHRRNVHHGQGAAAGRAARHRIPRGASRGAAARHRTALPACAQMASAATGPRVPGPDQPASGTVPSTFAGRRAVRRSARGTIDQATGPVSRPRRGLRSGVATW